MCSKPYKANGEKISEVDFCHEIKQVHNWLINYCESLMDVNPKMDKIHDDNKCRQLMTSMINIIGRIRIELFENVPKVTA